MTALWIALAVIAWVIIAVAVAVVIGRAVRLRDERDACTRRSDRADSHNKAS
jgi:hypothetical protein